MFSSQIFQEGQMHFQFITHWTREHAELEDFQPHRRIFGVSSSCEPNYLQYRLIISSIE
jgi:hypothetical protein